MQLTTKTRYAVRAMADLLNQPGNKPVPLAIIAQRQGVKPKYLEQIFLKLHRANLIVSKKGPGGGYFIERKPATIKLSEIMEAVGESRAPVFCVGGMKHKFCPRYKYCPTRPYWKKLKTILDDFFNKYTLGEMCKPIDRDH